MLLHSDGRAQVVLGALDVVGAHLAPLVLRHDLLKLLVRVQHVPVHVNCRLLSDVATLLQVVQVRGNSVIVLRLLAEHRLLRVTVLRCFIAISVARM